MKRRRFTALLLATWLLALAGCTGRNTGNHTEPASIPEPSLVLATFGPQGRYELSVGACSDGECVIQVALVEEGRRIFMHALDWRCAEGSPVHGPVGGFDGVGDPLKPSVGVTAWVFGAEHEMCAVAAQAVGLRGGTSALIVHQRVGFDHVKRRHYLLVDKQDKIERAHMWDEGSGPVWSWIDVVPGDADGSYIKYYRGLFLQSDTEPDSMEVTLYGWKPETRTLESAAPGKGPAVHVAVAASYDSLGDARQAYGRLTNCSDVFWVLPSDAINGLPPGKFVLGAVTTSEELARGALVNAGDCTGEDGSVMEYRLSDGS